MAYVANGMAVTPMIGRTVWGYINGFYAWQVKFYSIGELSYIL